MTRIAKERRVKTAKARAASIEAGVKRADAWGPNLHPSSQSYSPVILPRGGVLAVTPGHPRTIAHKTRT
jgi:hypothetical protein